MVDVCEELLETGLGRTVEDGAIAFASNGTAVDEVHGVCGVPRKRKRVSHDHDTDALSLQSLDLAKNKSYAFDVLSGCHFIEK